jgi:DNA-binding TFAR19-related protein (PDSD5 family)
MAYVQYLRYNIQSRGRLRRIKMIVRDCKGQVQQQLLTLSLVRYIETHVEKLVQVSGAKKPN